MRFYPKAHNAYCGIDLPARTMYVCLVHRDEEGLLHRHMPANPEAFLKAIAPYRDDLVVAAECRFIWYWLADVCAPAGVTFVLGHAQYMKAIHGGKAKNDRSAAQKSAVLRRGGMLPQASVYPAPMRATRDLLRRWLQLVRKRAELLTPIRNTTSQYNLPALEKPLPSQGQRQRIARRFPEPAVQKSLEVALALIDSYDQLLRELERHIEAPALRKRRAQ
jgi:hypothetical protein